MPDRILRLGVLTSDAVNKLTWPAEIFYRRLMSVADDYGRFDGRTVILRASLYPLQLDRVRDSDIYAWIGECREAELVRLYSCVNGKPHLEILKFGQRIQSKSKWPEPVDKRGQPTSTVVHGESPPIRSRYSESESYSKTAPPTPAAIRLPQNVEEAIAFCGGAGVPDSFVKEVFLEHEGTAWTFAGKPVTNFKSYVSSRWMRVKDIQSQREKYMTAPKKQVHRQAQAPRLVEIPTWMAPVEEIKRLLSDPEGNRVRLRELGNSIPNEAWRFLGSEADPLRKICK